MNIDLQRLLPFVVGTEGNVSFRNENGFSIKRSGTSLKDALFIQCNIDGVPLSDQLYKPSMEVGFHSEIYKRSQYKVIAHTHPTNTLKVLCSHPVVYFEFAHERLFPDQVVFNGYSSLVLPYATPGKDLVDIIQRYIKTPMPKLILLANHGIICCGDSVNEVAIMTEICEKAAEIFLGCDRPIFLTEKQKQSILSHPDEIYRHDHIR